MTLKTLFSMAAGLSLVLAVSWVFFPATMLRSWNASTDEITVYMSRRYGGLLFGYTVMLWMSRNAPPSPARRAIVVAGFVLSCVMTALSLMGVLSGTIGPSAWGAVVVEALLLVGFGYFCFAARE